MRRLTRILAAAVFGLLVGTVASQAQTQLMHPVNTTWRYLADGTDQGTAWSAKVFDDSTWPTGMGLFGNDIGANLYPYPFNSYFPGPATGGVMVAYYRGKFTWSGGLSGVVLTGTNYIDDGDVVYLHGTGMLRFNMPAGPIMNSTLALGTFGEPILLRISVGLDALTNGNANPLVVGENTIAVESHNNATTSSDTVFGLALYAQQSVA